jgi:hypothetical protein
VKGKNMSEGEKPVVEEFPAKERVAGVNDSRAKLVDGLAEVSTALGDPEKMKSMAAALASLDNDALRQLHNQMGFIAQFTSKFVEASQTDVEAGPHVFQKKANQLADDFAPFLNKIAIGHRFMSVPEIVESSLATIEPTMLGQLQDFKARLSVLQSDKYYQPTEERGEGWFLAEKSKTGADRKDFERMSEIFDGLIEKYSTE